MHTAAPTPPRVAIYDAARLATAASAIPDAAAARGSAAQFSALVQRGALPAPDTTGATVEAARASGDAAATLIEREFGRNSWDGHGSPLSIVVNATDASGKVLADAGWHPREGVMLLGTLPGSVPDALARATDVVTHEAMHAVMSRIVPEPTDPNPFTGLFDKAVGEAWADVLASRVDGNLVVGESIPADSGMVARDLRAPRISHMDQLTNVVDGEEHSLSGIPAKAGALFADAAGHERAARVWFDAIPHIKSSGNLDFGAAATMTAARAREDAAEVLPLLSSAWRDVGINVAP